jgi:hypothetical protein
MKRMFYLVFVWFCVFSSESQIMERDDLSLNSIVSILNSNFNPDWSVKRFGNRVILEKKDSVCIFNAGELVSPKRENAVHYCYQLFMDFRDNDFQYKDAVRKAVNDSIKMIITEYRNQKFIKGKYITQTEAIEMLESRLIPEPFILKQYDLWFSDNTNLDWIICEIAELKHFPLPVPTQFQTKLLSIKEQIKNLLRQNGF